MAFVCFEKKPVSHPVVLRRLIKQQQVPHRFFSKDIKTILSHSAASVFVHHSKFAANVSVGSFPGITAPQR